MLITLPKHPNEETLKMLIKANHFLEHAKQHAFLDNDFDIMIAIHNLDNAIEYTLRILIRHLEVEEVTGKTINTCELAQLIGEIQRYLKENTNQSLSYVQEMKMIRELRNMVQHAMILPVKEVQTYITYGTRFFEKTLIKFFGITSNDIRYSTLIQSQIIKEQLHKAEEKINSGHYLESIVASRDAFDYANFIYNNDFTHRIERAPALSELKDISFNLYCYLKDIDKKVSLDMASVDVYKYQRYMEYIDYIPSEYQADWHGNSILQRPWEKGDAEFCYLFVANTILHWELCKYKPIHISNLDMESVPIKFIEKMCDVDTGEVFQEYGCKYGSDDKSARLFYCDQNGIDKIKNSLKKEVISAEFMRYLGENLDAHHTNLLKVYNYDINLIMNNPVTWEVMIIYKDIPFTRKDSSGLDKINIDECDEKSLIASGVDRKIIDIVLSFMSENSPIDTVEKAYDLDRRLKNINNDQKNFISPNLIKCLSNS
ncbi:hypothetical protein ACXATD_003743 [Clostridium sporogenes]